LSTVFFPSVSGVKYDPALKTGDSGMYSLFGNYALGTIYAQIKVVSVAGTNVTLNLTDYPTPGFANGGGVMWVDVFSGQSNNSSSTLFFAVAAGLSLGDAIFNGWTVRVLGVQPQPCGGQSRQLVGTQYTASSGEVVNAAWDQSTGILCNYGGNDQRGGVLGLALDNTTLWSPVSASAQDELTTAFEITTFLGAPLVVLIVFVYMRRRRRKR
jgi:hypothetical protein